MYSQRLRMLNKSCWMLVSALVCAASSPALAQQNFPALTARVMDVADLLDPAAESRLDNLLAEHEAVTGNQLVVATTPSLEGRPISSYSLSLARQWQLGTAENDNGVLLLVAPAEREVRIEVGRGLEGALTDATSGQIIRREILPAFREDDYSRGIELGVGSVLAAIAGEYTASPSARTSPPGSEIPGFFIPILFITTAVLPNLFRRKKWRRVTRAAFPASLAGLVAFSMSQFLLFALAVALLVFSAMVLFGPQRNAVGHSRRSRTHGYGGYHGGSRGGFGGGGFGGGGGGFGGGGSSGSW